MNRPIKPLLAPLIFLLVVFLSWIFRVQLWAWATEVLPKLKDIGGELNNWSTILVNLATLTGLVWLAIKWVWQCGNPQSALPPSANPVASISPHRDLAKLYYHALDAKCQVFRPDIVAPDLVERKLNLSLSDIYQDQHIRLSDGNKGQGRLAETSESIPLMQALEKVKDKRLVIRGRVGAGKSCFINYLAHSVIRSHETTAVDLPRGMLKCPVVRVLLRETGPQLSADGQPRPGLLWRLVKFEVEKTLARGLNEQGNQALQETEFNSFWDGFQASFKAQGILLLDGLDEVSETEHRRENLRRAIDEFAEKPRRFSSSLPVGPMPMKPENRGWSGFSKRIWNR